MLPYMKNGAVCLDCPKLLAQYHIRHLKKHYIRILNQVLSMLFHSSHSDALCIVTGCFSKGADNNVPEESHSIIRVTDSSLSFPSQADLVFRGIDAVSISGAEPVFIRIFLSDPANQTAYVREFLKRECPISVIGQAPLDGSKIAAWVWCRNSAHVKPFSDNLCMVSWNGVKEMWLTCGLSGKESAYAQTVELLDGLSSVLPLHGMTLRDNCVRTWLFVQNIDVNYKGVVDGRNAVFDSNRLTPDTHFIASTGIEGRTMDYNHKVMLDALSVSGPGVSVRYLYGASHLNRTSEYGVRFERGTVVEYPDRRHVFISGTASIDNKGKILYEGDIVRQVERMTENVGVLLAEAGCGFGQVGAMIVYLRDIADYNVVKKLFDNRFAEIPYVIVQAPVCRPGWLVEMECVAIRFN